MYEADLGQALLAPERAPRLVIRPLKLADLDGFHRLHSAAAMHGPDGLGADDTGAHADLAHSSSVLQDIVADWTADGLGYFALDQLGSGDSSLEVGRPRLVAVGGVRRSGYLRRNGEHRGDGSWNVYYRVAAASRGRGYAGALVAAAAQRCEQLEPGALLSARIHPANTASRRVAEKAGLQLVTSTLDHVGEPELLFSGLAARLARSALAAHRIQMAV